MSVIISDQASSIEFLFSTGERKILDKTNINLKESGTILRKHVYITNSEGFINTADNDVIKLHYTEVTSPVVASNQELIEAILGFKASSGIPIGDVRVTDGTDVLAVNSNGSINVDATLYNQTAPVVIFPFSKLEESTTLAVGVSIGDNTATFTSVTGVSAGKIITFFNQDAIRFTLMRAVGTPVGNVVTFDRLFDFAYTAGSYIDISDVNLAANGSVTPVLYGVRNNAGAIPPPGINLSFDITRLMFQCITTNLPEIDSFGDITAGLANGLYCKKRDGEVRNIFNVQTNGELAGIMYDVDIYEAAKFGVNGFAARLTFAGQNKMGTAIRLAINEDLEILVQDDLSSLLRLSVVAEGSIVED